MKVDANWTRVIYKRNPSPPPHYLFIPAQLLDALSNNPLIYLVTQ